MNNEVIVQGHRSKLNSEIKTKGMNMQITILVDCTLKLSGLDKGFRLLGIWHSSAKDDSSKATF
jgi:hypothetical protein